MIATINAAGIAIPPHVIAKGRMVRALHSFNTKKSPLWYTVERLRNRTDQTGNRQTLVYRHVHLKHQSRTTPTAYP